MPTAQKCPVCDGSGKITKLCEPGHDGPCGETSETCHGCDGKGWVAFGGPQTAQVWLYDPALGSAKQVTPSEPDEVDNAKFFGTLGDVLRGWDDDYIREHGMLMMAMATAEKWRRLAVRLGVVS